MSSSPGSTPAPTPGLRRALTGTPLGACLAMALGTLATTAGAAEAQSGPSGDAPRPTPPGTSTVTLDTLSVVASPDTGTLNTNTAKTGSSRLPDTVRDVPQTINVVPQELLEQQHALTLQQALRNVPGITLSSGEGRGGQLGDQFRIRGLSAAGDIYSDGLKDFGVYSHDVFDTEAVDVVKGPSGENFGVGNSGGVINQVAKHAGLDNFGRIDQVIGSGMTYRTTADVNQVLGDGVALRVNGVYNRQDVADRDNIAANRKGLAVDLGVGLTSDTTWHLNYSYLEGRSKPDQGVSMVQGADGIFRPATEYGLSRSTSYTRNLDHDDTEDHVVTSLLTHQLTDAVSLYNDTRLSRYQRAFATTTPAAVSLSALNTPGALLSYGAGGGVAYTQEGWGVQDVGGAKIDTTVAGLRNRINAGFDFNYINDQRVIGTWYNRTANQTIVNPQHAYAGNAYVVYPSNAQTRSNVTNGALFLSDRVWFTDKVSVQGGLRADYFRTGYGTTYAAAPGGVQVNKVLSPSASLIYEPTSQSSLYFTYSHSAKPQGSDVAQAVNTGGGATSQTVNGNAFNPEQTDLYEVGGKADFLDGKLGVTGALFRLEKSNSYHIDDSTGTVTDGFSEAGLGERIQGFELGLNGKITDAWSVNASYAYMTGEVTASKSSPTAIGKTAPDVPENSFNIWTSYRVAEHLTSLLPGKVLVGGGVQYATDYWADSANTARIPDTLSLDAMVSYEDDRLSLGFNAYNLSNHLNYDSSFSTSRAVPSSGRTFLGSVGVKF